MLEKTDRFASCQSTDIFNDPYVNLLKWLNWKPVAQLCIECQLLLMHRYVNKTRFMLPGVLQVRPDTQYSFRGTVRHQQQRTISQQVYTYPTARTRKTIRNWPFYFTAHAWNALLEDFCALPFSEFRCHVRKLEFFQNIETD